MMFNKNSLDHSRVSELTTHSVRDTMYGTSNLVSFMRNGQGTGQEDSLGTSRKKCCTAHGPESENQNTSPNPSCSPPVRGAIPAVARKTRSTIGTPLTFYLSPASSSRRRIEPHLPSYRDRAARSSARHAGCPGIADLAVLLPCALFASRRLASQCFRLHHPPLSAQHWPSSVSS
jgi:hypothetical protein